MLDRFCLSVRGMSAPQDTKLRPTPVNSGSDELRVLQGYSREAQAVFAEERVVHFARRVGCGLQVVCLVERGPEQESGKGRPFASKRPRSKDDFYEQ